MSGKLILASFILTASLQLNAQKSIMESGMIEYERKTNIHKVNQDNEWFERMKANVGKYHIAYYELSFTTDQSYFKVGKREAPAANLGWFTPPAVNNQVYTNFKTGQVVSSKPVFEETYLVKDSLRNIEWKITNEYRDILGFDCRKAVGKYCDSVVVVAFYTDKIASSVGPEGFGGLPGGILGLAIPRMYTTWFATKITPPDPNAPFVFEEPKKGKETNPKKIETDLRSALKDWGQYVNKVLWFILA